MNFRTIIVVVYFWLSTAIASLFLPFIFLMKFLGFKKARNKMVLKAVSLWARNIIWSCGIKTTIIGIENLPNHNKICFVSNHQSNLDIPMILGNVPRIIGFLGKAELKKVPFLSTWMRVLNCAFINRKKRYESISTIEKRIDGIRAGHPMLIFPESKRSKSATMQKFRRGGLKSIVESDITLVPLTISGTYKSMEEKKQIRPGKSTLIIHQPIDLKIITDTERDDIYITLRDIIDPANNKTLLNNL